MKLRIAALIPLALAGAAAAFWSGCASLTLTGSRPPRVAGPPVDQKFVLGPAGFAAGDSIRIDSVECSSPDFAPGDRVIVHGWYDLNSRDRAVLGLFLTSNGASGRTRDSRSQIKRVERGVGPFALECVIAGDGALHVSYYPQGGGSSFGGIYFGTDAQMDWISGMNLW